MSHLTATKLQTGRASAPLQHAPGSRSVVRMSLAPRPSTNQSTKQSIDKLAAGLLGAAAAITLALAPPALALEPFLKSTGARGLLAQEEENLLKLRESKERMAKDELLTLKTEFEEEVRADYAEGASTGQLCVTPFGIDIVGITEFVALTGALVGGISARRRKQELEKLNEQLRTINTQLRQQARVGTIYAPGLTYAPLGQDENEMGANGASTATATAAAVVVTPLPPVPAVDEVVQPEAPPSVSEVAIGLMSVDEEESPEAKQCQQALKEGKRLLKEKNAGPAMVRFEKALMLGKHLGDKVRERRAVRGLAAASRLAGQYRMAITHLERVLEISSEMGEYTGDADAYGTIADVYTDMGEFEKAAEFYDKYINRMNQDGPV